MAEHLTLDVRGHTVAFHIYIDVAGSADKVSHLERFFQRLPDEHLAVLYPIFVIQVKPGGGNSGGTWRPGEVRSQFIGRPNRTGVPDEDVMSLVVGPGTGMIGLPRARWEKPLARLPYSVFHEVAHCIDVSLGLVPGGATEADFAGISPRRCGAPSLVTRRVIEAYARYICNPNMVLSETLETGETPVAATARIIGHLRRSRAFNRVTSAWRPR
jgi:hypothetical protein